MVTTGTAPSRYEALYTWRFSERSLLIRLYLFVYGDEKRSSINFCKLFWGTCFLPLTLPLTVAVKVGGVLGRGAAFTGKTAGRTVAGVARFVWALPFIAAARHAVAKYLSASAEESRAKSEAQARAREGRRAQEELGYHLWFYEYHAEVPPPKPTPSRRIMDSAAALADRMSAWWQAHPGVGRALDRTFLLIGRVVVRGVFYPLMVLAPVFLTALAVWETWRHRSGLVDFCLGPLRVMRHVGWLCLRYGGEGVGIFVLAVVAGVVALTLLAGVIWLGGRVRARKDARWNAMTQEQRVKRMERVGRMPAWFTGEGVAYSPSSQTWGTRAADWSLPTPRVVLALLDVTDYSMTRVGRVLGGGARRVGRGLRYCGHGVRRATGGVGRGFATTGRFFVDGHHAVKTRTCPRILIDSER